MSQPVSRLLHPFETPRNPSLEPEVARAILASRALQAKSPRRPQRKPRGADSVAEQGGR